MPNINKAMGLALASGLGMRCKEQLLSLRHALKQVLNGPSSHKISLLLAAAFAACTYVYVVIRAYYVPPFCDEIISFFQFIRPGDMQPFYAKMDPNNHIINSLLSRGFYLLLGEGIFILRIANLLAFGLFLTYLFKFQRFFKNPWVWLAWFGAMVVPQYFLDFFHLSRGYGLSMAFLMGALFHGLSFQMKGGIHHLIGACVLTSLAVWSNLTLTLTAAMVGMWLCHSWLIRHLRSLSVAKHMFYFGTLVVLFFLPLLAAIYYGLELKKVGMLYYGADSGFWDKSIIRTAKFICDDWILGGVLVINSLFVYLILSGHNFRSREESNFLGLNLVFWGTVASIILMHHLLGVKYPVDRATNHLFIMFFTVLFLAIDVSERTVAYMAGSVLFGFFAFNTLSSANLSSTRLWESEHVPKAYYDELVSWKEAHGYAPNVSAHGLHQLVLSYHDYLNNGELNSIAEPGIPKKHADFVLINSDIEMPYAEEYDTIYFDHTSGNGLLQLIEDPVWIPLDTSQNLNTQASEQYSNLAMFKVDSLRGRAISLISEFSASSPKRIKDWQLVYKITNAEGHEIIYHRSDLHLTHPLVETRTTINSRCLIAEIPADAHAISVFVWNVKQVPLEISDSKVVLFTLENR